MSIIRRLQPSILASAIALATSASAQTLPIKSDDWAQDQINFLEQITNLAETTNRDANKSACLLWSHEGQRIDMHSAGQFCAVAGLQFMAQEPTDMRTSVHMMMLACSNRSLSGCMGATTIEDISLSDDDIAFLTSYDAMGGWMEELGFMGDNKRAIMADYVNDRYCMVFRDWNVSEEMAAKCN